jgi:hypothetical protein
VLFLDSLNLTHFHAPMSVLFRQYPKAYCDAKALRPIKSMFPWTPVSVSGSENARIASKGRGGLVKAPYQLRKFHSITLFRTESLKRGKELHDLTMGRQCDSMEYRKRRKSWLPIPPPQARDRNASLCLSQSFFAALTVNM